MRDVPLDETFVHQVRQDTLDLSILHLNPLPPQRRGEHGELNLILLTVDSWPGGDQCVNKGELWG